MECMLYVSFFPSCLYFLTCSSKTSPILFTIVSSPSDGLKKSPVSRLKVKSYEPSGPFLVRVRCCDGLFLSLPASGELWSFGWYMVSLFILIRKCRIIVFLPLKITKLFYYTQNKYILWYRRRCVSSNQPFIKKITKLFYYTQNKYIW